MGVQFGHQLVIGGFNFRRRVFCHAELHGRFAHATGCVQRHIAALFNRQMRHGEEAELLQNKVEIIAVKIPTIMHGWTQHAFAAKDFHYQRADEMFGRFRIGRLARHIAAFKPVNNIAAILHNLAARGLHNRNNPAPNGRANMRLIMRVSR